MHEKLMKILNDYYGESRSDAHKEEIVDFLEMQGDLILPILAEQFSDDQPAEPVAVDMQSQYFPEIPNITRRFSQRPGTMV